MKVLINRVFNLDGTWQGYKLYPTTAHSEPTWIEPGRQFQTLSEIIDFYQL